MNGLFSQSYSLNTSDEGTALGGIPEETLSDSAPIHNLEDGIAQVDTVPGADE